MKQKFKKFSRIILILCITFLLFNCANDGISEQKVSQTNLKDAISWLKQYESNSENYFLFQNLDYDWNEAKLTTSQDGTETIIIPINELKKDQRDFWEQRLYIYKTDKEDYKALLYEIYTNKDIQEKSQSIDRGDFIGYISVWDLKTGFVRAARFVNNKVVETGYVEITDYIQRNLTNKAPIEAPCTYSGADGGCDKGGGETATPLREVIVYGPSKGAPIEYYGQRSPVIGGSDTSGYMSSNGGASAGGSNGNVNTGTTTITSYEQLVDLLKSTNPNGYNITFTQDQNGVISGIQINVVPWAGVQIFVQQNKIGDKYIIQNVTTNMTGLTVGFTWSQTNYSQTTNAYATTITLNGVWAYNLFVEGIATVYSSPTSYRVTIDNRTGKITDGKRL